MEVTLHARGLRDVLQDAVLFYRHNFMDIVTIAAIAGAAVASVGIGLGAMFNTAFSNIFEHLGRSTANPLEALSAVMGSQALPAAVLFFLSFFVISAVMTGALAYAVSERFAGRRISVARAYAASLGPVIPIATMALLFGASVGFLSVTILGLPLAAYLAVQWLFSCEALAVEKQGFLTAIQRSAHLARGSEWRLFGIMGTVCAAGAAVSFLLLWVPYVGPLAVGLFVWPLIILASVLLYFDMRVRKEGLTVWELARQMVTSEG
jgi:hypothetical protein